MRGKSVEGGISRHNSVSALFWTMDMSNGKDTGMGLFGGRDERESEIEALRGLVEDGAKARKKLATTLVEERKRAAELAAEVEKWKAEAEKARQAAQQARRRQKASVERANRFKARMDAGSSPVQSS